MWLFFFFRGGKGGRGNATIQGRVWEWSSVFAYWIRKSISGKLLFVILCGICTRKINLLKMKSSE